MLKHQTHHPRCVKFWNVFFPELIVQDDVVDEKEEEEEEERHTTTFSL